MREEGRGEGVKDRGGRTYDVYLFNLMLLLNRRPFVQLPTSCLIRSPPQARSHTNDFEFPLSKSALLLNSSVSVLIPSLVPGFHLLLIKLCGF